MKLLIMQSSLSFHHFLLGPNIFLSTLISYSLILRSYIRVGDQVSHMYKTTG